MDEQIYFPSNCTKCGFWTIQEVIFVTGGANLLCTHCNESGFMEGSKAKIKKTVADIKKAFPHLAVGNPQLLNLKKPGDHVAIPKKD